MSKEQGYANSSAPRADSAAAPPSLPDVNAETYPYDYVQYLLDLTADFQMFAIPDASHTSAATLTPAQPEDFFGLNGGYGLSLRSTLHRFDSLVGMPSGDTGLQIAQAVGEAEGTFRCLFMLGSGDLEWTPGRNPQPAIYDPWRAQRFSMLDCEFSFGGEDFFRGYGTGRTFPVVTAGRPRLLVGGVGNLMEGFGKFRGMTATYALSGSITPGLGFLGQINCRVVDPEGRLRSGREIHALTAVDDPAHDDAYIVLRGLKKDSTVRTTFGPSPGGGLVSLVTPSHMRSVQNSFTRRGGGLRTERTIGQVVADMEAVVFFNLTAPPGTAERPVPFTTEEVYTFRDGNGRAAGTINAEVIEGISFGLSFPSAPRQAGVRFAGFGPVTGGTGPFEGVQGVLTVNSFIGIAPHALSLLHILYIDDPEGRFRTSRGPRRSSQSASHSSSQSSSSSSTSSHDSSRASGGPSRQDSSRGASSQEGVERYAEHGDFAVNLHHLDEYTDKYVEWRQGFRKCAPQLSAFVANLYNSRLDVGDFPGLAIDEASLRDIFAGPIKPFDPETFNRYGGSAKGDFKIYEFSTGREIESSILYSYWDRGVFDVNGRKAKKITGSFIDYFRPDGLPPRGEKKVDILVNSYRPDVGLVSWVEIYQRVPQQRTSFAYKLPHKHEILWFVRDVSLGGQPVRDNVFMASHEWKGTAGDKVYYYMVGIFLEIDFDSCTARVHGDRYWRALYVEESPARQ